MRTFSPITVLIAAISATLMPFSAQGQDGGTSPTLFVAPLKPDTALMTLWQPAVGQGLAEMLITELTKINKFQVLESTAIEQLKDEIRLGQDGFVAAGEKVEKGGFAGADFMFVGTVTRFGGGTKGIGLGGFIPGSGGNLGLKTTKNEVRIDWRIVDAFSRKVIHSGNAEASHNGVGFDVGVGVNGKGGSIGFDNKEFMGSGLGKATAKAVSNIVAAVRGVAVPVSGRQQNKAKAEQSVQMAAQQAAQAQKAALDSAAAALRSTPGKVLAVPTKNIVIVSLGSKHGFKVGEKLKVYELVETKDDKGNVVFTEEKPAGDVTIDAVNAESSKTAYTGDREIKPGWLVKGS